MPGRRRYHLHWSGVVFAVLTVLIGAATSQRRENLLVWVFASMLAWIVVSGICSGGMMMAVRVRRIAPSRGSVGALLQIQYEVSSASRFWSIFELRILEMAGERATPAFLAYCGRSTATSAVGTLTPIARGQLLLDRMRCVSAFPFGLIVKSVEFSEPSEVLIHPKVSAMQGDALHRLCSRQAGSGQRPMPMRRGSEEFHGLREYRPGDPLRSVAWRRSASLPVLVVLDRAVPNTRSLRIVLDLRAVGDSRSRGEEEQAIEVTASLASHAIQSGWEVGLAVLGCSVTHCDTARGRLDELEILDLLARIDLATGRSTAGAVGDDRAESTVTIVPGSQAQRRDRVGSVSIGGVALSKLCQGVVDA